MHSSIVGSSPLSLLSLILSIALFQLYIGPLTHFFSTWDKARFVCFTKELSIDPVAPEEVKRGTRARRCLGVSLSAQGVFSLGDR